MDLVDNSAKSHLLKSEDLMFRVLSLYSQMNEIISVCQNQMLKTKLHPAKTWSS